MKQSQKQIVKAKLRRDGEATSVWAMQNHIFRLSERIREIRLDGWKIEGDFIPGSKTYRYTLVDAPKVRHYRIDPVTRTATLI